jgi:serine/threonine protein kinase
MTMGHHASVPPPPRVVGRYALCREIAIGGMATVHLGRLVAEGGFARTVAIKRLLPQYAKDSEFSTMFLQEARLAARIRHPNVVPTLDVVSTRGELFLVMEYVHGESLAQLVRLAKKSGDRLPQTILVSIVSSALQGLHAAHEATSEAGDPLNLVHRDVSPQNVLVDVDGVARVIDFGVAKAVTSAHTTRSGQVKGKIKYMAPEQILGQPVSRRTDVFAAGIILWEGLTGRRLFDGEHEATVLHAVLHRELEAPSKVASDINAKLDAVVMRALQRDPDKRFASAGEMSAALEAAMGPATQRDVGDWVKRVARERLSHRRAHLSEVEQINSLEAFASTPPPPSSAAIGEMPSDGLRTGNTTTPDGLERSGTGSVMSALSVSAPLSASVGRPRKRTGLLLPIAAMGIVGVAAGVGLFVTLGGGEPGGDAGAAAAPAAAPVETNLEETTDVVAAAPAAAPTPTESANIDPSAPSASAEPSAPPAIAARPAPAPKATPTPAKPASAKPAPTQPAPRPTGASGSLYSRD